MLLLDINLLLTLSLLSQVLAFSFEMYSADLIRISIFEMLLEGS